MPKSHLATESGIQNKRSNDKLGQTPKASDRQRWRTLITALYAIVVAGSNGFSNRQNCIDKDFTQRITLTLNRILIQIHCKNHAYRHYFGKYRARLDEGGKKRLLHRFYTGLIRLND